MAEDEERQNYVIGLVNEINRILAGEDNAETCTALMLAVTCQIVATSSTNEERAAQARGFAEQLNDSLTREEVVEWISAHTMHIVGSRRNQ